MSVAEQVFAEEKRDRTGSIRSRVKFTTTQEGSSGELILFIHGAFFPEGRTKRFLDFAASKFPQAELAGIRYKRGLFFASSTFQLAADLQAALVRYIWERQNARRAAGEPGFEFSRITIVANSAGALLMRKAITWLNGQIEDHPEPERARRLNLATKEIAPSDLPLRLVLFAGMTRGWTVHGRAVGGAGATLFVRAYRWGASFCRTMHAFFPITKSYPGQFFLGLEQGSPLVANLRIQWLRTRENRRMDVVQILGYQDDLVYVSDHHDVATRDRFALLAVMHKDHRSIWKLTEEGDLLEHAMTRPIHDLRRRLEHKKVEIPDAEEIAKEKGLVFIMHGIRDNSDWPRELATMVARFGNYKCITSSYGHFPMLGFLSKARRAKNVRWFMDQYAEAMACRPHLVKQEGEEFPVHFVGHSNGTYLLAEGLREYASLRVNRASFMGSVVPRDFAWDRFGPDRIQGLRNDRGASDWVVGWFPTFYQIVRGFSYRLFRRPKHNDLGNGGFRGFDHAVRRHHENYYFPGGHSGMIVRDNLQSIARYVTTGTNPETPSRLLRHPSGPVSLVSRLCWLLWIVLTVVILGGAYYVGSLATPEHGSMWWKGCAAATGWLAFWFLVFETA